MITSILSSFGVDDGTADFDEDAESADFFRTSSNRPGSECSFRICELIMVNTSDFFEIGTGFVASWRAFLLVRASLPTLTNPFPSRSSMQKSSERPEIEQRCIF